MNRDAYLVWRENEVTKMFMRDLEDGLKDHIENTGWGKTVEEIGINAVIRKAKIEEIQKVLDWKIEDESDDSND